MLVVAPPGALAAAAAGWLPPELQAESAAAPRMSVATIRNGRVLVTGGSLVVWNEGRCEDDDPDH